MGVATAATNSKASSFTPESVLTTFGKQMLIFSSSLIQPQLRYQFNPASSAHTFPCLSKIVPAAKFSSELCW